MALKTPEINQQH